MTSFKASSCHSLNGSIKVPGDKSISHRSIMLGSIANGITNVSGFLEGEDSLATLRAFQQMGVQIERMGSNITIHGVGKHGLSYPSESLDLGNSGTSIRLMSGLLSAQSFNSQLCGDESLSKRPMARVIEPLSMMGALIDSYESKPPLSITGNQKLSAINYTLPVASAQIKSCLLLAGLYAEGETCIVENSTTRDHTERMLRGFGYPVKTSNGQISLMGGGELHACWKLPYQEEFYKKLKTKYKKNQKCEKAEKIQQRLIQLKTNYSDRDDLRKQCKALKKTLYQIQKKSNL